MWQWDYVRSMYSRIAWKSSPLIPYRIGKEPADTSREQVIYARKLYESAFHPDTGDLQNVFGRMSFQVPGGMAITGAMLQFYRYFAGLRSHWKFDSFRATVTGDPFVQSYRHFGETPKMFRQPRRINFTYSISILIKYIFVDRAPMISFPELISWSKRSCCFFSDILYTNCADSI